MSVGIVVAYCRKFAGSPYVATTLVYTSTRGLNTAWLLQLSEIRRLHPSRSTRTTSEQPPRGVGWMAGRRGLRPLFGAQRSEKRAEVPRKALRNGGKLCAHCHI